MADLFARDFSSDLDQLPLILDKVCEHRPWFDDRVWEQPALRRVVATRHLAETFVNGRVWTVWRGKSLTGIMLLTDVDFGRGSASCHFVFFDRSLADKVALVRNTMAWVFDELKLDTLRLEIPTYASILARWARKRLGFRYESEARPLSGTTRQLTEHEAELGSRKFHAIRYKGQWHDAVLLSLIREEFDSERAKHLQGERQHGSIAGPDEPVPATAGGDVRLPAGSRRPS